MDRNATLLAAGLALALISLSGVMQKRRGIDRWSFVPWDYAMVLGAVLLLAALAHLALLWRDS